MIAPHTPPTAYFAILFQGILGELLFAKKTNLVIPAILLGVMVTMQSGLQRIVTLTLFYGENIWKSINAFTEYVLNQLDFISVPESFDFSLTVIIIYLSMHLIGGILAGFLAYKIASSLRKLLEDRDFIKELKDLPIVEELKVKKREKKRGKLKVSHLLIVLLSLLLIYLSVTEELKTNIAAMDMIIMLVRGAVIIFLWYFVLAPYAKKWMQKFVRYKKNKYAAEIDRVISLFAFMRKLIKAAWNYSSKKRGFSRLVLLFNSTIILLLFYDESNE